MTVVEDPGRATRHRPRPTRSDAVVTVVAVVALSTIGVAVVLAATVGATVQGLAGVRRDRERGPASTTPGTPTAVTNADGRS
jgi:hypothetical protein